MTGPAVAGRRRAARARAWFAGVLLAAYALLLLFLAYLATIDAAAILRPLAVAGAVGVITSTAVFVANLRLAAQRSTTSSSARWLLWASIAVVIVAVAGLLAVGVYQLVAADTSVGLVALATTVLAVGPLAPAAVSLPAAHRR